MMMYRKKRMKNTKRHSPGLSAHAAKLLKRRQQRLHSHFGKGGKGHKLTSRLAESIFTPSTTPVAITTSQVTEVCISITLLGKMTMTLYVPGGIVRAVPLDLSSGSLQLLAYLAWKHSTGVRRDLLVEQIWGHRGTGKEAIPEKLGEAFNNAKKALRSAIKKSVEQLNSERGEMLLDPKPLDIFICRNKMWSLSPICQVVDLELVEREYQIIVDAEKQGLRYSTVPESIKEACDRLIVAYKGDFFEDFITTAYPEELKPWVRRPFTAYRDYYLKATWYTAEFELQAGQLYANEGNSSRDEARQKQQQHWGRAAECYKTYALYACNSRYDLKVGFGLDGRPHGERVIMSESALRLSVVLYGAIGRIDLVDELYSAFYRYMTKISDKWWKPSEETLRAVQAAKNQTDAYQFLAQVTRIGSIQSN